MHVVSDIYPCITPSLDCSFIHSTISLSFISYFPIFLIFRLAGKQADRQAGNYTNNTINHHCFCDYSCLHGNKEKL